MSNLPLQPLIWKDLSHGEVCVIRADSPTYDYAIMSDSKAFKIGYYNLQSPIKYATGFATIADAKAWAWNHYNEKMQPYVKRDTISNHFDNFTQWANDRQIIQNGNVLAQGLKLVSEIGELADNLAKGRCIKDDIGDCFVVLNNLAHMTGVTLDECLAQAWSDIKDRKGTMNEHGVFIKDGDTAND